MNLKRFETPITYLVIIIALVAGSYVFFQIMALIRNPQYYEFTIENLARITLMIYSYFVATKIIESVKLLKLNLDERNRPRLGLIVCLLVYVLLMASGYYLFQAHPLIMASRRWWNPDMEGIF